MPRFLSRGHSAGTAFQLSYLLIKVFVKMALDEAGVRLLQLVLVEIYKYDSNIVEEFVYPGDVQERLVNSLNGKRSPSANVEMC